MAKFTSNNLPDYQLSDINEKLSTLIDIEQQELKFYKTQEKYQVYKNNEESNDKQSVENERYKKYNRDIKKSSGFVSDMLSWITKMGVLLVSYKVSEWFADSKNTKKVATLLKGFYEISKFVVNFTSGIFNFIKDIPKNLDKLGKSFNNFFGDTINALKIITDPIGYTIKTLNSIPKVLGEGFGRMMFDIYKGIETSSTESVKLASSTIKDGVNSLSDKKTEESVKQNDTTSSAVATPATHTTSTIELPKIDNNQIIKAVEPDNVPKLAKGGVVTKQQSTTNNIKPLSSLILGTNEKFNSNIKSIAPKFEELMKLPFTVIGGGIVSILKAAIKDNPESNNTVTPLLNSIGKMFNVPVGDSDIKLEMGTDAPTESKSDISENTTDKNSVENLLSSILKELSDKLLKPLQQKSSGGSLGDSGSGWIHGSQQGYPVSLNDGSSTSFIGHGTEYVSKHKTNNSSFVIPFDTPSTKSNKNLTKTRLNEAMAGGYDLPKMANGGKMINRQINKPVVKPDTENLKYYDNGYNTGVQYEILHTNNRHKYKIAKVLSARFKGFVDELESTGYMIGDIGGYDPRLGENNKNGQFAHPYGAAIDINPHENPYTTNPNGKLVTDFPENITQIAKKYGLGWGGNWKSKKDTMHFSAMKREGGDGFNGKEIGKGVLSGGKNDKFTLQKNKTDTTTTPETQVVAPPTPTPAAATTPEIQTTPETQATSTIPDFGKIGNAFSQITQMLGLGGSDDKNKLTVPSSKPSPTTKSTPAPSQTTTPTPSPTKLPRMRDHLTASNTNKNNNTTTLIKSGTTNNIADRNTYSASGFNYDSDTHRFTALSSMSGSVTESIFV